MLAFDKADEYRNPVMILSDGILGQIMEPFYSTQYVRPELPEKTWTLTGCKGRLPNVIKSLYMGDGDLELRNKLLQEKYRKMKNRDVRYEALFTEDADLIVVAFGIAARIVLSVIKRLKHEGHKVGMFRPITLFPFPEKQLNSLANDKRIFLTVELNAGQMIEDVRLAINGRSEVYFYGRPGGAIMTPEEIYEKILHYLNITSAGNKPAS